MHANVALLHKLFAALHAHDHETMASCYHCRARFRDIAFNLHGRARIRNMWRMICSDDVGIKVEVGAVEADDHAGRIGLVEHYTFGASKDPPKEGRPVVNVITSRFLFEGGRIIRQDDDCDPKEWARQAVGDGVAGFLAGRIRLVRSIVAYAKLAKFVRAHRKPRD